MGSSVYIDPQYDGIVMLSPDILFFNDAQPRPDGRKIYHIFEQNEGLTLPDEMAEIIDKDDFELKRRQLISKASENSLQNIQQTLAKNGINIENWINVPKDCNSLVSVESPQTLLANSSYLKLNSFDSLNSNSNDSFESALSDDFDNAAVEDPDYPILKKSSVIGTNNPLDRRKSHRLKSDTKVSAKKTKKKKKKRSCSEEKILPEHQAFYDKREETVAPSSYKPLFGSAIGFTKCHICSELTKLSSYETHLLEHLEIKNEINIKQCASDYEGNHGSDLLLVNLKQEPLDSTCIFKCYLCNYIALSKTDLHDHCNTHIDDKPFLCKQCNYSCEVYKDVEAHLDECHSFNEEITISVDSLSLRDDLIRYSGNGRSYENNTYQEETLQPSLLHPQSGIKLENKLYYCHYCAYSSACGISLSNHVASHADKPYKCKFCDYESSHKSDYKYHTKIHEGREIFKCSSCYFSTDCKDSLDHHELLHSEDKRYKCTECFYQTAHKKSLKRHMEKHKNDKTFKCPDCDYSCFRKSYMVRHVKTHTGEKPIFCFVCDYRCIQIHCLQKHLEKHNDSLMQCAFCYFSTLKSKVMTSHLREAHSKDIWENSFQCTKCNFKCFREDDLIKHAKDHIATAPSNVEYPKTDTKTVKEKVYLCKKCDFSTYVKKHLKFHRKKLH